MQLTRAADYAVRVMIHMATLRPGTRVSRTSLAAAAEVPTHFLSKVLQSLGRSGLIVANRGNGGGFTLAVPARQVTVLHVVEAIEGPIQLNLCTRNRPGCSRRSWCPGHAVWMDAQAALTGVLKNASIEKLARQVPATPPGKVLRPWN